VTSFDAPYHAGVSHGRLAQRVLDITESATLAVDTRAKELKASGVDVIGFGAGEPDFPTPAHIVAAAAAAAAELRHHRYSPTAGLPELRSAVAAKTLRDSGYQVEAGQVLICNGAKHALYNAFMTLVQPGDEVLLPAPYWVSYPEAIELAGGRIVELPTTEDSGFRVTPEQLEAATTDATKLLVFVSPSNPTGAVYAPAEVEAIGRWAADRGIWVLTDEIYEHLVYGDNRSSSMPVLAPELADRCLVVNGVSKTYAMTGWRVGWLIGPPDVIAAAASLQSHATSNVANVAQAAALAAVSGDLEAVRAMAAAFDRRRTALYKLLNDIPGVVCHEPQGAFYCFPSFRERLGDVIGGRRVATTVDLAEVVLERARVAIVPGEAFGAPGYARLSYALADDDLSEGAGRIAELLA
jgi:aspartate aminotransferase